MSQRPPTVALLDLLAAVPFPVWNEVAPSNAKIEALQAELIDLNTRAQTIQAVADKENRPLNEEEEREIVAINAQFEAVESDIERRQQILAQSSRLNQSMGRRTTPEGPQEDDVDPAPQRVVRNQAPEPKPRKQTNNIEFPGLDKRTGGFKSLGEFALAVRNASFKGARVVDQRLEILNATLSTYGSEGVDSDGGYAVPPDFRTNLMSLIMAEDSLLGRTDAMTTTSNSIVFPVDETTPWQTTGGIQVYWGSEAGTAMSQSKPALQDRRIPLHKLYALVPMSEESIEDAPSMTAFLNRKVPEKMAFAINLAIVQGNGSGKPLGLLNSPALVSVAKETAQAADTISTENILKMYSRMYAPSRQRAVWLINQDIEPQLFQLTMGLNNLPVYLPPNGLSQSPFSTIMGRPVVPTQACETLGDQGDIIFADLAQYLSVTKTSGVRQDVSMHLWFDQDTLAFRFVFRIGGQPWWSTTMSPRDGSNTLSPFVTLDAR